MIENWINAHTFHYKDYSEIKRLVDLKNKKNLTISVGLPTRNVDDTIGLILEVIKKDLMEDNPLIDQLAIIDSHSSDKTLDIAKDLGVQVYFEDKILPGAGAFKGKGEALWKSLAVLSGDIIIWIDSDIKNIDSRFVYGLIGPLLAESEIKFTKAFYRRPIAVGDRLEESGGGRVTELVARPLLNIFYPHLAGFIQPLSGEYGGFREIFEQIPFYTGYAVETGLLVEISKTFGVDCMAQVDLAQRVHVNQTTVALGKMSFAILQAVFEMLKEDGKITLEQDISKVLNCINYTDRDYQISEEEINIVKRCPINQVPEYLRVRGEGRERV